MIWAVRLVLGLLVLLVLGVGAVVLQRAALVSFAVERALEQVGLTDADVAVSGVGLDQLDLSINGGGGSDLRGELTVTYDWQELLANRQVRTITLNDLAATIILSESGGVQVQGLSLPTGEGGSGPTLPFDRLVVADASLLVRTPQGDARATGEGELTVGEGGAFTFEAQSARAGLRDVLVEEATLSGQIDLGADLTATAEAALAADFFVYGAAIRDLEVAAAGDLAPWSAFFGGETDPADLRGQGIVTISSASLTAEDNAALADLQAAAGPFAEDLSQVSLRGALRAQMAGGVLELSAEDGGLVATGADGAVLSLSPQAEAPFFRASRESLTAGALLTVETTPLAGQVTASLMRNAETRLSLKAEGELSRAQLGGLQLGPSEFSSRGTLGESGFEGTTDLASTILAANLGALKISGATINAPLNLSIDPDFGILTVESQEGACLRSERARLRSLNGTFDATLAGIGFCPTGDPFATLSLRGGFGAISAAGLTVRRIDAQIGQTDLIARSLNIDLIGNLSREARETSLALDLRGGAIDVGSQLAFSQMRAGGHLTISDGTAVGGGTIRQVRIAQQGEAPKVAPVVGSGELSLAGDELGFTLSIADPEARRLGAVTGSHTFRTGEGQARFESERLRFGPGGMQPAGLIPALRGIISRATGAVSGTATAAWARGALDTGASLTLDDLSFQGPGVAVKETSGLIGTLTFTNLLPLTTPPAQRLEIGRIDLSAIAIEDGTADLRFPGDRTVRVARVDFPWFDGALYAEDAVIAFDGTADATLRADDVDLGIALDYFDIAGLSGQGRVKGTLPLTVRDFSVEVVDGRLEAVAPGRIQYTGEAANALGDMDGGAQIAFDVLEDLAFRDLVATVNGPLDGTLDFTFDFVGNGKVRLTQAGLDAPVDAPIILRTKIEAPLLSLIDQARLSTDAQRQIRQGLSESANEGGAP